MNETTTIGLDVAKHVFQVHGVAAGGTVTVKRRLLRSEVIRFFDRLPRCRGVLRPAVEPTFGRARSLHSATK